MDKEDTPAFGLGIGDGTVSTANGFPEIKLPQTTAKWAIMRENIQNYIRCLNFKYRVRLREKEVTYLNKFGSFVDNHTLEVVDKKGRVSTITSSRFLFVTGGRPTPLPIPGGELSWQFLRMMSLPWRRNLVRPCASVPRIFVWNVLVSWLVWDLIQQWQYVVFFCVALTASVRKRSMKT